MAQPFSISKLCVDVGQGTLAALKPAEGSARPVICYISALLLIMTSLYVTDVPQGLLPFIPGLLMLGIPHSYRLGVQRILVLLVGCVVSYVVTLLFLQQPWFLLPIVLLQIFVGMYLMKRGLDILSAILYIFLPVVVAWSGFAGESPADVAWNNLRGVFVGIVVCELTMILLLPKRVEHALTRTLSAKLRELASTFGGGRVKGEEVGWTPAWSAGLNNSLQMLTLERGKKSDSVKQFYTIVATVRLLVGLNHARYKLVKETNYDGLENIAPRGWLIYQMRLKRLLLSMADNLLVPPTRKQVLKTQRTLDRLTRVVEEMVVNRERELEKIDRVMWMGLLSVNRKILATIRGVSEGTSLNVAVEQELTGAITANATVSSVLSTVKSLAHPGRFPLIFAIKGMAAGGFAFAFTSIWPEWGGSAGLLLMTMFLSSLNVSGLAGLFVGRMFGLIAAVIPCFLFITLIAPNTNDYWISLIAIAIFIYPAALLSIQPTTAGIGLSYTMSFLFVITSYPYPFVVLAPIQWRLLAVAGSVIVAFLAFTLILPVYARQEARSYSSRALDTLSGLLREGFTKVRVTQNYYVERVRKRYQCYAFILAGAKSVSDSRLELQQYPQRYANLGDMLLHVVSLFALDTVLELNRESKRHLGDFSGIDNRITECLDSFGKFIAKLIYALEQDSDVLHYSSWQKDLAAHSEKVNELILVIEEELLADNANREAIRFYFTEAALMWVMIETMDKIALLSDKTSRLEVLRQIEPLPRATS